MDGFSELAAAPCWHLNQSDYYSNRAIARHGLQQAGGSKNITFPAIPAEEEEEHNNNNNNTEPRPAAAADFFLKKFPWSKQN